MIGKTQPPDWYAEGPTEASCRRLSLIATFIHQGDWAKIEALIEEDRSVVTVTCPSSTHGF